jgi:enamine deaminase RidA (YjgF/YER057c/UK114 family)
MQIVEGGIEAQTRQALKNLEGVVKASGSSLGQIVKTTVRPPSIQFTSETYVGGIGVGCRCF